MKENVRGERMIQWENIKYDIGTAEKEFNLLEVGINSVSPITDDANFIKLRERLIEARDKIFVEKKYDYSNKPLQYEFDLLFGLEVYEILNESIGFNNRVATNDEVWRYLMIRMIPDIAHARWGFNRQRFYAESRRIWLKAIWWYIELSWAGSKEETYRILKNNKVDTISSLIERPGIGYHIELYREIMRQYGEINANDNSREVFRGAMVLNTARMLTISPDLTDGGVEGYVKRLFEDVTS